VQGSILILRRASLLPLTALAAGLAGCAGNFDSSPLGASFLSTSNWSVLGTRDAEFDSSRPLTADDYVDADGRCGSVAVVETPQAAVGTPAGDLATAPPPPLGGVALGMSECQVAQRAGQPTRVDLSAAEGGERKVVLTYMTGPWPGIYNFFGGRLKEVERVAVAEPVKPKPKKRAARPKTPVR
jgi:hypothetical protein